MQMKKNRHKEFALRQKSFLTSFAKRWCIFLATFFLAPSYPIALGVSFGIIMNVLLLLLISFSWRRWRCIGRTNSKPRGTPPFIWGSTNRDLSSFFPFGRDEDQRWKDNLQSSPLRKHTYIVEQGQIWFKDLWDRQDGTEKASWSHRKSEF